MKLKKIVLYIAVFLFLLCFIKSSNLKSKFQVKTELELKSKTNAELKNNKSTKFYMGNGEEDYNKMDTSDIIHAESKQFNFYFFIFGKQTNQ